MKNEEEKRQALRDANKRYRQSPKGRKKLKEAQKRYRQTENGKKKAREILYRTRLRTNNKYQKEYYQKNKERIKAYELKKYYDRRRQEGKA